MYGVVCVVCGVCVVCVVCVVCGVRERAREREREVGSNPTAYSLQPAAYTLQGYLAHKETPTPLGPP